MLDSAVAFFRRLVPGTGSWRTGSRAESTSPNRVENPSIAVESASHLCEAGRYAEALAAVDEALTGRADDADLRWLRASILFAWGRHREAHPLLARLERDGRRDASLYTKLGWTCFWLGRLADAEIAMRNAVSSQPDDWASHFGLASVLRASKRTIDATAEFERALALKPGDAHCVSNLIACAVELDRLDTAEHYARSAVALAPASSSAMIDLGIVFCSQARYDEAVTAFERADELEFDPLDARDESVNYAICLLRAGRARHAMDVIRRKLRSHPGGALHYHYALALLTTGNFDEGFEQYEFRWLQEPLLSWRQDFGRPTWDGQDLRGKTILLRAEQGYGDFIQFIRFAPLVKARGASVVLYAREELHGLVADNAAIDRIVGSGQPYPPFDYHIHLLSIPRVLRISPTTIPAETPYMHADAQLQSAWRDVVEKDSTLNVGLVWAGSPTHLGDRFRSLPVACLDRLLSADGVTFWSLQKGPVAAQLASVTARGNVVDVADRLHTFADTAAAIDAMDVVIGVDTAVIHLAGAMGKPVWTLVAIPGDWRWGEAGDDSAWYPTMRIFRQRKPGDWSGVVDHVLTALSETVRAKEKGDTHGIGVVHPSVTTDPGDEPKLPIDDELCRVRETRHGIVMYFPDDSRAAHSIEFYGESNPLRTEALLRLVASGMTVVAVGASGCGIDALPLARALGPAGQLILYEDDALHRQVLRENLTSNGIDNATLMRRPLRRVRAPTETQSASDQRTEIAPPSDTIDDLRLERLNWIRVGERADAEDVLRGAAATLWRLRPGLFVDIAAGDCMDHALAAARDFGYSCWRMRFPWFDTRNFNRRDADLFDGAAAQVMLAFPEEAGIKLPVPGAERIA